MPRGCSVCHAVRDVGLAADDRLARCISLDEGFSAAGPSLSTVADVRANAPHTASLRTRRAAARRSPSDLIGRSDI